jgi:hypothetical protein
MLGRRYQTVIAPDCWFGPEGPQDYADLYESDWILHPVANVTSTLSIACRSPYTVVTAYYPLDKLTSKHTQSESMEWIRHMDIPIVIFTPATHASFFREMRTSRLVVVEREFDDLVMWSSSYRPMWETTWSRDPQKSTICPEMYALRANSAFFVKEAFEMNVFASTNFVWMDYDCVRSET